MDYISASRKTLPAQHSKAPIKAHNYAQSRIKTHDPSVHCAVIVNAHSELHKVMTVVDTAS